MMVEGRGNHNGMMNLRTHINRRSNTLLHRKQYPGLLPNLWRDASLRWQCDSLEDPAIRLLITLLSSTVP